MANHPNRRTIEARNEPTTRDSACFEAIGYRYGANGWSDRRVLFRFYADLFSEAGHRGAPSIIEIADRFREPGVGGLARHGCEDVEAVRQRGMGAAGEWKRSGR